MLHRILLVLLAAPAAAQQPADTTPVAWQRARAVWFVEGANPVGAEVCVGTEAAPWSDALEQTFSAAAPGDRLPLGDAGWATLDTFTALRSDDAKVDKGCYYLALERGRDGWALALFDPVRIQKAQLLPAGAARQKPLARLPLQHATGAAAPLGCELAPTGEGTVELRLQWGPHRLATTLDVASAKGASPIAQVEARGASRIDGGRAGGDRQAFALLDHGRPAWSSELAAAARELPKGRRWRLGQNWWTTLDSNVALTLGGRKLAAGSWHLSLKKTGNDAWALVCTPARDDVGAQLDAFAVDQSKAAVEVPLTAATAGEPAKTLQVACEARDGAHRLRIAFGGHELTARIELH